MDPISHKIYIGSRGTERFYAYDSDGVRLWDTDLDNDIEATAVIDKTGLASDGNVYVGTADDNTEPDARVYGFDRNATGPIPATLWPYFITNQDVSSRPVLSADGSTLFLVTDIGIVYSLPTATGFPANWTRDIPAVDFIDVGIWSSGAAADGTVYVATNDGDLYAFNPANGNNRPGFPIVY